MIENGLVEYGHYYSYILDFGQNLWRKFNDTHVVVVGEDDVMKDALGIPNLNSFDITVSLGKGVQAMSVPTVSSTFWTLFARKNTRTSHCASTLPSRTGR